MDKRALVVLGCSVVVVFYLLLSISSPASKDEFAHSYDGLDQSGTYMPQHWDGLPISYDNNFFIPKSHKTNPIAKLLYEQTVTIPHDTWASLDWWYFEMWVNKIGWNGVLDALNKGNKIEDQGVPTHYKHHIGEMIAQTVSKPEHAMELTSTNMLIRAPLHGAVWYYVVNYPNVNDFDGLFEYIDKRLCYYKGQVEELIWISCAHGVGHGLARIFNTSLETGFEVCARHPINDFAYGCATGVTMDLAPSIESWGQSAAPCDSVILSTACWRFKDHFFAINGWDAKPCENMPQLNQRGCIFSQAHSLVDDVLDSERFCSKYRPSTTPSKSDFHWRNYMACLEGSWQSRHIYKQPDPQAYCNQWQEDFVRELCETHISGDEENGDYEKWNFDILEIV